MEPTSSRRSPPSKRPSTAASTLIDTAPVYGFGRSEEIVGKALAEGGRRDRAVIATKVALDWRDGKVFRNATAARIRQELEDSLRRLRTDRIDLYQVHWPDPLVPIEETARALEALHAQGKIRAIGVSNFTPGADGTRSALSRRSMRCSRPTTCSSAASKRTCCPTPHGAGITVLAYGALCRGLLSGQDHREHAVRAAMTCARPIPSSSSRASSSTSPRSRTCESLAHGQRSARRVLALAVRWILDQGGTIALWGARTPEQIAPVEDTLEWSLDAAAKQEIDRILKDDIRDPVGPEFMAPPLRAAA